MCIGERTSEERFKSDKENLMSAKPVVTVVSRTLSIYFLAWLLYDLTYLPSQLFSFLRYEIGLNTSVGTGYWRNYYLISLCFLVLRMVALFFAVQWFYRCGPRIQRYFLASSEEEATAA
jgi:hypothetical protein